jgi:SAM-dependent methyltransferase
MVKLTDFIKPSDLQFIKSNEQMWLEGVFKKYNGFPTLENLWKIMDKIWEEFDCDPKSLDSRIISFYSHPVWLLNGLFTEHDELSILNRKIFTEWVCTKKPKRVADYGGGFGSLGRMIAKFCPDVDVEIIEPHPHQLAFEKAKYYNNCSYQKKLEGEYDVLIATDVFEHVPDPLGLVAKTSMSLKNNGHYLIANCFQPVIKCHLPQSYHLHHTFNKALEAMNLKITEKVSYGSVFILNQKLNLDKARKIEKKSKKLWYITKYFHRRIEGKIANFVI